MLQIAALMASSPQLAGRRWTVVGEGGLRGVVTLQALMDGMPAS
ncbi:hypothetical protein [Streptosporangium sp. NBC_01756]|nr:hypothetical protein [Streptosporangium sp. NBC_01756]WSC89580.1 hypothetical protein OIE48_15780 [Streptosporangium sp. NBC_01756]